MNDLPRQQLRKLIANYGRSLCDDPQRCEALLKDLCRGQYRREIYALVDALKERVAADLLASQNSVSPEVLRQRLAKRLHDNRPLAEDAAIWAVESWALALGVIPPNIIQEQARTSSKLVSNHRGRKQPESSTTTQQSQLNVVGSSQAPSRPSSWETLGILGILGIVVVGVIVSHHPQSIDSQPLSTTASSPVENTPSPSISETQQPSENAEFFLNRGKDKFDRKDYTGAIADYNQAIQLNPHDDRAYNNRGCAYYGLGDYQAALADYNQAIQLNPHNARAYRNRADADYRLEDYSGSFKDFQQAFELGIKN